MQNKKGFSYYDFLVFILQDKYFLFDFKTKETIQEMKEHIKTLEEIRKNGY
jgi:hypothetical protein